MSGDVYICVDAIKFRSEWDKWEAMSQQAKYLAMNLLTDQFGNRCDEFEDGCPCCQRWKAFDDLFANPHEELTVK
jgi:hypothetical protein